MASMWSRIVRTFRPRRKTTRSRAPFKRWLRIEGLEGRRLLTNDLVEISGTVFTDLTDNGLDGSDTRIASATVTLFRDGGNNTYDNGTGDDVQVGVAQTTDTNGDYTFDDTYGITAGRYFVVQSAVTGLLQRTSQTVQTVDVTASDGLGTDATIIDSFSTGTQAVSATISGTDPDSDALTAAGVLGGERDLFVDALTGTSNVSISVDTGTGLLEFQAGAATTGTRTLSYDGADADGATIDAATGLGGIDLTNSGTETGFKLKLGTEAIVSDNSLLVIRVYSSAANVSIASALIPSTGGAATGDLTIPFSDFTIESGTGADFTSVNALQFDFSDALSDNGQVDFIATATPTIKTVNFANLNPMSIGNLVWQDLNNDGIKDTGETGLSGITVQLYQDTNSNNAYDDGVDAIVDTGTTDSSGNYLFTDLLPGSYGALIAISEFGTGQPLLGYAASSGTVADPDNDVDNDNNGSLITSVGVATAALTLTAGGEPTSDGDSNTNSNLSLDFGFVPQFDLAVTKSDTPDPATAGNTVTYTITVTNTNDSPISATNVSLTDTLPDGIQVTSVTGSVGSTAIPTGNISIPTTASDATAANPDDIVVTIGTLLRDVSSTSTPTDGSQATIVVVANILSSTRGTLTNTAVATADGNLINTSDDTATATTTVQATSGLSITKTDTPDPAVAGQTVTYTIDVVNSGPSDATTVVLTDNLPDGIKVTSVTGTIGSSTIASGSITIPATAGDDTAANNDDIVVAIGTLIPNVSSTSTPTDGSAAQIIVVATVLAATAPGTLTNNASVVSTEQTTPVTTQADTAITNEIDLAISKDTSPTNTTAIAGQNLTYVLTVSNNGPSTASNVRVIDDLPAGVTLVSVTPSAGTHITGSGLGDVVVEIPTMTSGQDETITIVVAVAAATSGSIVNSASVALVNPTGFTDTDNTNDTDSISTTVAQNVDLVVTKVGSPDPVVAGQNVTYTMTVTNDGPSNASSVSLSDNIPDGIQITSVVGTVGSTSIPSGSITIPTTASDTTASNPDNVVIAIGTLVANTSSTSTPTTGSSATITVIGKVLPSTRGTLSNVATATASGTLINTSDDSATATTTVTATSGLTITKTDSADPIVAGNNLTYTIVVTNNGPSDATTVNLTDNLPDGIQITSVTGTVGSTAIASSAITIPSSASDTTAANGDDVTVSIGTLIPNTSSTSTPTTGSSATITVVAKVLPETRNTITNAASVVSTEQTTPVTASADTTISTQMDLSITKTGSSSTAANGATLTYTLTVTNAGPSTATNVVVTDQLPSQLTFSSASASQGTASNSSGTVTANLGSIAPNSSATVTINTTVNATSPISVTNVATVQATETESNITNNTATVSTQLGQVRTISGRVFIDEDYDGKLGSLDHGLAGMILVLRTTSGTEVARTTSDADGNYSFTNISEGEYDLVQIQSVTTYEGMGIDDGLNDIAGTRSTLTDNNTMRIVLSNGDSTGNSFIWFRQSLRHLCTPFGQSATLANQNRPGV